MYNTVETELLEFFKKMGLTTQNMENYSITGIPIKEGEKQVGSMNNLEIACWSLLEQKKKEHQVLHEKMEKTEDPVESKKLDAQHDSLQSLEKIIRSILLGSINQRYPDADAGSGVGIRDGNVIVSRVPEEENPIEELMNMMFPGLHVSVMRVKVGN